MEGGRPIRARDLEFLTGELDFWRSEGLMDGDRAGAILGLYAVRRRSWGRVLLNLGMGLAALGVLCFAAVHWEVLSRLFVVLRGWVLDLMRVLTRWGVGVALGVAALTGAAASLLTGKEGHPLISSLGLGVAGIFGLALSYPLCWEDSTILLALAPARLLAAGAALLTALLMLWHLHGGRASGGAFLVLIVLRYLFDGIFSLVSRAWGFTLLGVVCLVLGLWLEYRRRGER